jgi:predicted MFS family arabinose efflux permease
VLGTPAMLVLIVESFLLNAHWAFWNAWIPIYGLAVGISLGQVGVVRGVFGVTNAVSRMLGGQFVGRLGAGRLAMVAVVAQCLLLMLLPVVPYLAPLLVIFALVGVLRALGIVANTVGMVERSDAQGLGRGPMAGVLSTVTDLGVLAGPSVGGLIVQAVGPVQVFVLWPLAALALYAAALLASRLVPTATR